MKVQHNKVVLLVGCHVDDIIIVGVDDQVQWMRKQMNKQFKMEDLGQPTRLLGMNLEYLNDKSILLHQESYITKLLFKFNKDEAKEQPTPMDSGIRFTEQDLPKTEDEHSQFPYCELVASLLYLSICTRPCLVTTKAVCALQRILKITKNRSTLKSATSSLGKK